MPKSVKLTLFVAALSLLVAAPLAYGQTGRGADNVRWAQVDERGVIVAQTGGFRTVNCFRANANCYIDIGTEARNKGLFASIANQNNSGRPPSLTGEIGVGACGISVLKCAPPGTENNRVIVVTPRNSDGSETNASTRKRFYVQVLSR